MIKTVQNPQCIDLPRGDFDYKYLYMQSFIYHLHCLEQDNIRLVYCYSDLQKNVKDYYDEDIKGLPVRRRRNVELDENNFFEEPITNLIKTYSTDTNAASIKHIVTPKAQVMATIVQISSPLTFIVDVQKITDLNDNPSVELNTSTMPSFPIMKRKTTLSSFLLTILNKPNEP